MPQSAMPPERDGRHLIVLVGADTCRRYKRMREIVTEEAAQLGVPIQLVEENEVEGILKYRTVNLPLLFIDEEQVAQGNPPKREVVRKYLQRR